MTDAVLASTVTAAAGVVVAAITGVVSYRSARWSLRKDLEGDLRRQRLEAFKQLWALSEPLAMYGRPSPVVTVVTVDRLSKNLRHWYFAQGGMFLSDTSRKAYFAFQEALQAVVEHDRDTDEIDAETFTSLQHKSSELRDALRAAFKGFPQM